MGLFHVGCKVVNPANSQLAVIPKLMVDTRAGSTWIKAATLERIGVAARKRDLQSLMANGAIVTRSVGYAFLKVNRSETADEVVFAQPGDLQLLGARTLEGLNLKVDSRGKKLVAAGPIAVATAVPPRFGKLVQVTKTQSSQRRKNARQPSNRDLLVEVRTSGTVRGRSR